LAGENVRRGTQCCKAELTVVEVKKKKLKRGMEVGKEWWGTEGGGGAGFGGGEGLRGMRG